MHKDLKPENIMICGGEEGVKTGDVKVIDFGLSEIFVPGSASTQAAGTPYYMAPEVFHCKFNYKCDVWSVGVLMYLLLTAHLPFDAPDKEKYIKVVNTNAVSFPRKLFENISKEAVYLIKKMLTKDPACRPTASEVLSDPWFKKFFDDDDIVALTNIEKEIQRSVASPSSRPMSPPASPMRTACVSPSPFDNRRGAGVASSMHPSTPIRGSVASPVPHALQTPSHALPPQSFSPLPSALHSPLRTEQNNTMSPGRVSASGDGVPASPLRYLSRQGSKFLKFSRQTPFTRICLNLISMSLPTAAIINAPVVFRALDKDNDGLLSESELADGLIQLGVDADEVPRIIDALDVDDSGEISYSEFVAALIDMNSPEFEKSLYSVFRRFDINNDGYITREELSELLATGGVSMDASKSQGSAVDRIMNEIDTNGRGAVSFKAFCQFLRSSQLQQNTQSSSNDYALSSPTNNNFSVNNMNNLPSTLPVVPSTTHTPSSCIKNAFQQQNEQPQIFITPNSINHHHTAQQPERLSPLRVNVAQQQQMMMPSSPSGLLHQQQSPSSPQTAKVPQFLAPGSPSVNGSNTLGVNNGSPGRTGLMQFEQQPMMNTNNNVNHYTAFTTMQQQQQQARK
eukprot:GDKK01052500.1.p1 GENE.GDKK01052500.1~~GDKK01052500.1.p1  ORF type:complete len:625 (+),score=179.66 GDKK01052500.1:842-2716(+)